jgi:hypothetical protein
VGRPVLIDWDWGATGIWTVGSSEETPASVPAGEWRSAVGSRDRHRAWRGLLSDDLIDALQAWNDDGDLFMGRRAHEHTDEDRFAFWARGRELAARVQAQLGSEYEVRCGTPAAYLS